MFGKMISFIPDYMVFVQTAVVFLVPYLFTKLFKWVQKIEKE
jgi:flagellar biosynthesis protein FliQ